jgi:hypothetical protein
MTRSAKYSRLWRKLLQPLAQFQNRRKRQAARSEFYGVTKKRRSSAAPGAEWVLGKPRGALWRLSFGGPWLEELAAHGLLPKPERFRIANGRHAKSLDHSLRFRRRSQSAKAFEQ